MSSLHGHMYEVHPELIAQWAVHHLDSLSFVHIGKTFLAYSAVLLDHTANVFFAWSHVRSPPCIDCTVVGSPPSGLIVFRAYWHIGKTFLAYSSVS